MIGSTRSILRQISSHEIDPRMNLKRYGEKLRKNERSMALAIFIFTILIAINSIYDYSLVDDYLESKFKNDYILWKK